MDGPSHRQGDGGMALGRHNHGSVEGRMIRHGGCRSDGVDTDSIGGNHYRFDRRCNRFRGLFFFSCRIAGG